MTPTKQEILATSACWIAVTLNVVPGLGAGYLHQRRWKAYWITSALPQPGWSFGRERMSAWGLERSHRHLITASKTPVGHQRIQAIR